MADGTKFKGEGVNGKSSAGRHKSGHQHHSTGAGFPNGNLDWYLIERGKPGLKKKNIKLSEDSIIACDGKSDLADSFADYVDE